MNIISITRQILYMGYGTSDQSAQHANFLAYMRFMLHTYFEIEGLHAVCRNQCNTVDQLVMNLRIHAHYCAIMIACKYYDCMQEL